MMLHRFDYFPVVIVLFPNLLLSVLFALLARLFISTSAELRYLGP